MRIIPMLLAMAGCGGEEAPSCLNAMTHFYGAGCEFRNLETDAVIPRNEMVQFCQQVTVEAPTQCEDDLANWRACLGAVPSPASGNADCDCSSEFEALLSCE